MNTAFTRPNGTNGGTYQLTRRRLSDQIWTIPFLTDTRCLLLEGGKQNFASRALRRVKLYTRCTPPSSRMTASSADIPGLARSSCPAPRALLRQLVVVAETLDQVARRASCTIDQLLQLPSRLFPMPEEDHRARE